MTSGECVNLNLGSSPFKAKPVLYVFTFILHVLSCSPYFIILKFFILSTIKFLCKIIFLYIFLLKTFSWSHVPWKNSSPADIACFGWLKNKNWKWPVYTPLLELLCYLSFLSMFCIMFSIPIKYLCLDILFCWLHFIFLFFLRSLNILWIS